MPLLLAAIDYDLISLFKLLRNHVHDILGLMSLVCLLKYSFITFSSRFLSRHISSCFPVCLSDIYFFVFAVVHFLILFADIYIYIQSASEDSGWGLFAYTIYEEYQINLCDCSMYGHRYISFSFQLYIIKLTYRAYKVQFRFFNLKLDPYSHRRRRKFQWYSPAK